MEMRCEEARERRGKAYHPSRQVSKAGLFSGAEVLLRRASLASSSLLEGWGAS